MDGQGITTGPAGMYCTYKRMAPFSKPMANRFSPTNYLS